MVALMLALVVPNAALADANDASARMTRQMQIKMQINRQRYGIAGQAVWAAHNGRTIVQGVDGYADVDGKERLTADHVLPVYSLSKLFVSVLIMQLVEGGQVDLDQPASVYAPGLPASWRSISVRQFLNHQSGVPEYYDETQAKLVFPASLHAALYGLANKPLLFPAGTRTRYTGTNSLVLSMILERHYGKPYGEIADERIIKKLGLKYTGLGTGWLPETGVARAYIGKDGQLRKDDHIDWPVYSFAHGSLYSSLNDLSRFLQAVAAGELVGKATLQRLWQPPTLADGQRAGFASGWEYGESGAYREVGHDGGARVRVRIAFDDSLDGDTYTFIYLTNGSARNVWSRILLDSAMATLAPRRFPANVLSEQLIAFASKPANGRQQAALIRSIRANGAIKGQDLERTVNNSGYAIRENLGVDAAIGVFAINTELFPRSANSWDSLAEAYAARGDKDKAKALYAKARELSK